MEKKKELNQNSKNTKKTNSANSESLQYKINKIIMIVLVVLITIVAVCKIVHYFFNENKSYDKRAINISESNVDIGSLYLMKFNSELVVASEEVIFLNAKNNEANVNFTSAPSNKVLVRAEIFTDVSNLKEKPIKKFWTKLLYPKDKRLVRIGDTGWIESGKIIKKLKLDELPSKSCSITIRFTAANPANTNINAGMFSMNTDLVIVDYQGNMLDEHGVWQNLNNK